MQRIQCTVLPFSNKGTINQFFTLLGLYIAIFCILSFAFRFLNINDVELSDEGVYRCHTSEKTIATTTLVVECKFNCSLKYLIIWMPNTYILAMSYYSYMYMLPCSI